MDEGKGKVLRGKGIQGEGRGKTDGKRLTGNMDCEGKNNG